MKLLFLMFILVFSQDGFAQRSKNEIIVDSLKAKNMQKIGLGMHIVSLEDNKTVMISKNGRYVVKGTVTDMWDGMQNSGEQAAVYPNFPSQLDIEDFTIGFGNKEGKEVIAYVSYSCRQCVDLLTQVLAESFLSSHFVRILPLYNNKADELVVNNIYCSTDKKKTLIEMMVKRNLSKIDSKCLHSQPNMNVILANAQSIKALPSTFYKGENKVYLGLLPN